MNEQLMPRILIRTAFLPLSVLMVSGPLTSVPVLADENVKSSISTDHAIAKIIRGKTICTDTSQKESQHCGTDHWTVYVHSEGSRTMHVASETKRNGEVRHALIVVDADGTPHEAFMHNRSRTDRLGSTFVVLKEKSAAAASNDAGLGAMDPGIEIANVETAEFANSLSAGPASADGLHFLRYDFDSAGEQPRNIYWMGGSRQGTMTGSFRPTTHTYIGEKTVVMPNGDDTVVDHFRMSSGTEAWLTKEDRVVVRMDVKFGNVTGARYTLAEFEIIKTSP